MGRGAALLAAVAAIATALALSMTGSANAWENHGGCNFGEVLAKGATPANSFEFNICQRSADIHDVYGDFHAAATPPGNAVVHPAGPVTCADIKGNEVGFYYPFEGKESFPPANPVVNGLLIYAFDGGATGDKIGFAPVVGNANTDCSLTSPSLMGAKLAALPVTSGNITITQKGVTMASPTTTTSSANKFVP